VNYCPQKQILHESILPQRHSWMIQYSVQHNVANSEENSNSCSCSLARNAAEPLTAHFFGRVRPATTAIPGVLCFLDKQGRARRSNDHGQNQCVASRRLAETYNY
jgi:hypothetical protein